MVLRVMSMYVFVFIGRRSKFAAERTDKVFQVRMCVCVNAPVQISICTFPCTVLHVQKLYFGACVACANVCPFEGLYLPSFTGQPG